MLQLILFLYFADSYGDLCGAKAANRGAFMGGDHDLSSICGDDFIFDIWKHSGYQTHSSYPKEKVECTAF